MKSVGEIPQVGFVLIDLHQEPAAVVGSHKHLQKAEAVGYLRGSGITSGIRQDTILAQLLTPAIKAALQELE